MSPRAFSSWVTILSLLARGISAYISTRSDAARFLRRASRTTMPSHALTDRGPPRWRRLPLLGLASPRERLMGLYRPRLAAPHVGPRTGAAANPRRARRACPLRQRIADRPPPRGERLGRRRRCVVGRPKAGVARASDRAPSHRRYDERRRPAQRRMACASRAARRAAALPSARCVRQGRAYCATAGPRNAACARLMAAASPAARMASSACGTASGSSESAARRRSSRARTSSSMWATRRSRRRGAAAARAPSAIKAMHLWAGEEVHLVTGHACGKLCWWGEAKEA